MSRVHEWDSAERAAIARRQVYGFIVVCPAVHIATVIGLVRIESSLMTVVAFVVSLYLSVLGITLGYHRYFSHRVFTTSRWFQFVLGFFGCTALQNGPVWWAAVHRHHHRFSDQTEDFHSPRKGFWWSHTVWLTNPKAFAPDFQVVRDLTRYPELMWLDQFFIVPWLIYMGAMYGVGFVMEQTVPGWGIGRWQMFVWAGLLRTVALWHLTWSINSLMHIVGNKRYATNDDSRNSFILALLTLGEGWHNNHHRYMGSARNGFYWWQVDITYYVICVLRWLGLIHNVKTVTQKILDEGRTRALGP